MSGTDAEWFSKYEYVALRQEVLNIISQMDQYLFLSIGAVGLVIAWLTGNSRSLPSFFWFAPLAIVLVAFLVVRSRSRQLARIGAYLREIEVHHADAELGGWEHYQKSHPHRLSGWIANRILWLSLLFASAAFAVQRFV